MRKIIILWQINQKSSLGIYTQLLSQEFLKLSQEFLKSKKFEIINKQYDLTTKSYITWICTHIKNIFALFFPKKYTKDDIILIPHSSHVFPPLLLGAKAKKIHIVHDFFYYDESFFKNFWWFHRHIFYPFYYLKIHRFLYRIAFRNATRIVAISQATKNEIIAKFWKEFENKISVIYNGINHEVFQDMKIFPRNPNIPNKKYLFYIGTELKRKNLKNIIAGFSIFQKNNPEYIFIKAQNDIPFYRNITLSYIKENNLKIWEDFFFINSYLTHKEVAGLYQHAELFIFPSLQEGFGFPIIESQACGTPVITSNLEPMSELVPYKDFLANPNNPEDIARKISEIIKNPELREKLSQNGKQFAKNFTWEKTGKEFIKIFEK